MADAISAVKDEPRCLTSCIETQNRLLLKENFWRTELLKEYVCCLNPIAVRVQWWLSQQNWVLFRGSF